MSEVTLSTATARNLLALQRTTAAIAKTQERLATGLKINSALDGPIAFFDALTLTSRANGLLALKDNLNLAISKVDVAITGIAGVKAIIEQMKGLALDAKSEATAANRSKAAVQFNDLHSQLNNLVNDSSFRTTNLLRASPNNLTVTFSEDGSSTLTISGISSDSSALALSLAATNFVSDTEIDIAINQLDSALTTLRSSATTLGSNGDLLGLRLDFMDSLIGALEAGAGKLVDADLNEESATLLTLQTRQQLGTIGLSVAQLSDQAVLRLFN